MIKQNDLCEFTGHIIDMFEDFLTERNVWWENKERHEDDETAETAALFYGTEYGDLQQRIEEMLFMWNLIEQGD